MLNIPPGTKIEPPTPEVQERLRKMDMQLRRRAYEESEKLRNDRYKSEQKVLALRYHTPMPSH